MLKSVDKPRTSSTKGYLLAILASMTYGLNPMFAVPLYEIGLDVMSVLFYRYLFAAILLGIIIAIKKQSFHIPKNAFIPVILAGIFFALSSITLFQSYRYMDVGIASTILYVTPFFVAIIMATFFRQKIRLQGLLCIVASFIGIGLISVKYDSTIQSPFGIGLVIVSALVYAVYMVLINKTALNRMHIVPLTFYCLIVGILLFLLCTCIDNGITPLPATVPAYYNVIGIAVFPTIVSLVAMTVAIQSIGPVPTSVLEALEPVTALFIGFLMFGEVLTTLNLIGILIVISSVTFFVVSQHKHKLVE